MNSSSLALFGFLNPKAYITKLPLNRKTLETVWKISKKAEMPKTTNSSTLNLIFDIYFNWCNIFCQENLWCPNHLTKLVSFYLGVVYDEKAHKPNLMFEFAAVGIGG